MSTFGLVAILLLPILGGLIAWAGDVIGYRLGKSRRTLFGLRPRTTARLLGVAVGVALPLVGLGTALLGSNYARQAIFRLDKLIQQQETLTRENQKLAERVAHAREQATRATTRANALEVDVHRKALDLQAAQARLAEAQQRLGQAQGNLQRLRSNVGRLQLTTTELRHTKERLLQQVTRLDVDLKQIQDNLLVTARKLEDKTGELNRTTADLVRNEAELTARERDVKLLQAKMEALDRAFRAQRLVFTGPVLFEPGHELVRVIMNVQQSEEEMERALAQLVVLAGEVARQQGAADGPSGLAVHLDKPLPPEWQPTEELPTEQEIIHHMAQRLRQAPAGKYVVGVHVVRRAFKADNAPARVGLWEKPYERVFAKGEVIYAMPLEGKATRVEIFNQLWNLITKIVRREAKEKGLLPDPKTGEYGSLPSDQLLTALDDIATRQQQVRVEVTAARDTYTTDPLVIKIEVKSDAQSRRPTLSRDRG